jgi:hypothetical protein
MKKLVLPPIQFDHGSVAFDRFQEQIAALEAKGRKFHKNFVTETLISAILRQDREHRRPNQPPMTRNEASGHAANLIAQKLTLNITEDDEICAMRELQGGAGERKA